MDKKVKRTSSKYIKRKRSSTKAIVYKQVKNQLQRAAEKKFYDENYFINGLDLTGSLNNFFEPSVGTGGSDVIGIKATVTSIEVSVYIYSAGLATTNAYNQTRITCFTWKGFNTPTLADLYQVNTIDYQNLSPFTFGTKKQRKIHYDQVFDQYFVSTNGFAQDPNKTIKFYIPMANVKGRINEVVFDPNGTTNGLYLAIVSNNNGAANTKWLANVVTRVTFLDM